MTETGQGDELRSILHKRHDILAALVSEPRTKPELVDALDASRSTVDRAIRTLEDAGCIERQNSIYHPTQVGYVAFNEYNRYAKTTDGIARASDVLNAARPEARIDPVFLNGVTVQTADPHAPESALKDSIEILKTADRLLGLAPVVLSLYTETLTTLVREYNLDAELILYEDTLNSLLKYYQDQISKNNLLDHVDFYVTEQVLPYALWIMDHEEHPQAGITIHENGGVRGVLTNDSPEALQWAHDKYEQYLETAQSIAPKLNP